MVRDGREYDRDGTAILTDTYLKYMDPDDENPRGYVSNPSQFKRRFHDRISRGVLDLTLLFELLDADDLRETFGPHYAGSPEWSNSELQEKPKKVGNPAGAIPGAMAFFAWALCHEHEPQIQLGPFIEAVELGLNQYLREKHNLQANVTVEVDVRDGELYETPD